MFYPFASLILLKTQRQKSSFIKHINLNFIFKNVVWKKKKTPLKPKQLWQLQH